MTSIQETTPAVTADPITTSDKSEKPEGGRRGVRGGQRHQVATASGALAAATVKSEKAQAQACVPESSNSELVKKVSARIQHEASELLDVKMMEQQATFEEELEAKLRDMERAYEDQAAELIAKLKQANEKASYLESSGSALLAEVQRLSMHAAMPQDFLPRAHLSGQDAWSRTSTMAPPSPQSPLPHWPLQGPQTHHEIPAFPFPAAWSETEAVYPPPMSPQALHLALSPGISSGISPWSGVSPWSMVEEASVAPPGLEALSDMTSAAPPGLPAPPVEVTWPCSPAPPGLSLPDSPRGSSRSRTPQSSPQLGPRHVPFVSPTLSPSPGLSLSRRSRRSTPRSPFCDRQAFSLMSSPNLRCNVIAEEGGEMFTFTHRRNSHDVGWGVEFTHRTGEDNQGLHIHLVKDGGAMAAWNKQCAGGPAAGKALTTGDRIVSVNDVTDCEGMIEQFRAKLLLNVTVRRGLGEDDIDFDMLAQRPAPWQDEDQ